MNRERAETHLRLLAEAELRRAKTLPAADIPGRWNSAGLALVAHALSAVGAIEVGTADEVQADFELAVAVRQPGQVHQASPGRRGLSTDARMRLARLMRRPPRRIASGAFPVSSPGTGHPRPTFRGAPWRVVPVNQVIKVRDDDVRREVLIVAYARSADGARFIVTEWPSGPLTATAADDRGVSYQLAWRGEFAARAAAVPGPAAPDPLARPHYGNRRARHPH